MNARVGVAVFVFSSQGSSFIVGKRKGSHGAGTWALPGGHLEFGESFEECASREILEETGLRTSRAIFLTATNDVMEDEGKHYVTIVMASQVVREDAGKEPELREPHKCERWAWTTWHDLRSVMGKEDQTVGDDFDQGQQTEGLIKGKNQLFLPLRNLIEQRPGFSPSLK